MLGIGKRKQLKNLILTITLFTLVLSGCGGTGAVGTNTSTTAVATTQNATEAKADTETASTAKEAEKALAEPFQLSILVQLYTDPPATDNRFLAVIEERTNTKLDITWIPAASYTDKFTMTIASGEMPMAMLITDDKNSSYLTACEQGAFWDLTDRIGQYPNLIGQSSTMWTNAKVGGQNYLIPRAREVGRAGLIYRKDWLEKLGMKVPTNLDELEAMLRAFTTEDPDGNGQNDTFGLVLDQAGGAKDKNDIMLSTIASYFGAATSWGIGNDGKAYPAFEEKEFIDSLKWLRQLYADKVINQDFAVVQNIQQLFAKGKAGCYSNTNDDINRPEFLNDLPQNAPQGTVGAIIKVEGPKGKRAPYWGTGYFGGFVFPSNTIKNEEDLEKCLAFFNELAGSEIANMMSYGEEGIDYSVLADGKLERSADQIAKYSSDFGSIGQLGVGIGDITKRLMLANDTSGLAEMRAEVARIAVVNPILSITAPTLAEKGADLNKIVLDARVKFIMGAIDEAGYMDMVKQWHAAGGDKLCEEYTSGYAALK